MKNIIVLLLFVIIGLASAQGATHTVVTGDNLWNLAIENFGDGYEWHSIWDQNSQIEDPNLIYPGEKLVISGGVVSVTRNDGTVDKVGTTTFATDTTLSFDELTQGLFGTSTQDSLAQEDTSRTVPDSLNGRELTTQERLVLALSNSEMKAELLAYANEAFKIRQRAVPFAYNPDEDSVIIPVGKIDDDTRHTFIPYQKVRVRFDTTVSYEKGTYMEVYRRGKKIKHSRSKYEIIVPVATGNFIKSSEDTAIIELTEVYGEVRNKDFITIARTFNELSSFSIEETAPSVLDMNLISKLSTGATIPPFSYVIVDKGSEDGVQLGDIVQGYSVTKDGAADYFPSMVGVVRFVAKGVATIHIVKVIDFTIADEYLFKRVGRITYQ